VLESLFQIDPVFTLRDNGVWERAKKFVDEVTHGGSELVGFGIVIL
jgi:hypothetical protein